MTVELSCPTDNVPLMVDFGVLRKSVSVLRAINHKLRYQIICLIAQGEKLTVTDIYIHLKIEQSVASQHLAILRKSGIVLTSRSGKYIYYCINYDRMKEVCSLSKELAKT